jgi:hypothetical protein
VIAGTISFTAAPPPKKVKLTADPMCAKIHPAGLDVQPVRGRVAV